MRPAHLVRLIPAALVCAVVLVGAPANARADDPQAAPARPASSSVVVERVENTAILAPDFKYTNIDNVDGFLLGAYGGVLVDKTVFIGGGGYWMANGNDLHELGYGGLIVEWHFLRSKNASVSVGGLGGYGWARVPFSYAWDVCYPPGMQAPRHGGYGYCGYGEVGFMVGEPQVSAVFRVADGLSIAATVGYRFAAFASGQEDRLRGVTGGVSIRFGSTK
jgi:hypothetical protein